MSAAAPLYDRGDEPGLDVELSDLPADNWDGSGVDPKLGWEVQLSGEDWWETKDEAERARQEYAIAIADRVHGPELARLRRDLADAAEAHEQTTRAFFAAQEELVTLQKAVKST